MTAKRFDNEAANWDNKPRRVQLAEKISAAIATLPLNNTMQAMEFGCGTGLVSLALAPKVGSLTALDNSSGMLKVLQEKIDQGKISNIHCLQADIFTKDIEKRYDLIFCSMTLHHIKDTKALLQRFYALLNPGGYLAIADLSPEDGSFHKPEIEDCYHKGFDTTQLKGLCEELGFDAIRNDIVHTITKKESGKSYPIFLLTGKKAQ